MDMNILLIAQEATYFYFQDYVESLLRIAPAPLLSLAFWPCSLEKNDTLYVFLQGIPSGVFSQTNMALLNTEQLTRSCFMENVREWHAKGIPILDYSLENIQLSGLEHHYWWPYQDDLAPRLPKPLAVGMVGTLSEPRYDVFCRVHGATMMKGFGEERDAQLFQHKILVNIHYGKEYNVHEHMRTDRCIHQGMIVITEPSVFTDKLPLRKHMVVEERAKIPARVHHILKHYEECYKELLEPMDRHALQEENVRQFWRVVDLLRVLVVST
jgi:hypothetical protein